MCRRFVACLLASALLAGVAHADGSVNPQSLFDTGLNLGYLTRHAEKGSASGSYSTWAGNTAAEWTASWSSGSVGAIAPAPPYPSGALTAHTFYVEAIQFKQAEGCRQPWTRAALSLYRLARTLGMAYVEAGSDCTGCLRRDMQSAAIELANVGQTLSNAGVAGGATMTEMSVNLRTAAAGLRSGLSAASAAEQNASQATGLLEMITTLDALLPDTLQPCLPLDSGAATGAQGALSSLDLRTGSYTCSGGFGGLEITVARPGYAEGTYTDTWDTSAPGYVRLHGSADGWEGTWGEPGVNREGSFALTSITPDSFSGRWAVTEQGRFNGRTLPRSSGRVTCQRR